METPGDPHFLKPSRRARWWDTVFGILLFMALGAVALKLWQALPDRSEATWITDLAIAHRHTTSLARALTEQPPVSVAQADDMLASVRRARARLKDEEARAWLMQDLVDLDWARASLQQAETSERSAINLDALAAASIRGEAYESRRKAMLALGRIRQRGDPFARRVPTPASSASGTPASASAAASGAR
jgi:hypothetical protein